MLSSLFIVTETKQYDKIAASLMNIFLHEKKALLFLKVMIEREVQDTPQSSLLFRGNSIAVRLVSSFARAQCSQYLKKIVGPMVMKVQEESKKFEKAVIRKSVELKIDENLQKENYEFVSFNCNVFLDLIFQSLQMIPQDLKIIFVIIAHNVEKKFPGFSPIALGGIFFLRLICPSLVTPQTYDIIDSIYFYFY